MVKKNISMILALLICCSTLIAVFAQADHSHIEESDVSSNGHEEPAAVNATSPSPGTVITGPEMGIDLNYVFTAAADGEYLEWLLGAPDEILSASTMELLDYFLNTPFMGQQVYSCSSTPNEREIDFSCHEAFRELISREDFTEAVDAYAESILSGSKIDELDKAAFERLLVYLQ